MLLDGLAIGLLMTMTGAGGGALAVPLLLFTTALRIQDAAALSLATVGLVALMRSAWGLREGVVRYRAAAWMGGIGMLVAPLGVLGAARVPQRPLLVAFGVFLLWSGWRMLRPAALARHDPPCRRGAASPRLVWTRACTLALARVGAQAGLASGLLGIGGGFIIIPGLQRHTDLDVRSIQATSLAVMCLVAGSGVAAAAGHGHLPGPQLLPLASGALVGGLLGMRLNRRVAVERIRLLFAAVGAGVALLLFQRAWNLG